MSEHGWVAWDGQRANLRADPYRNENDDLICPLEDGSDLVCKGAYPTSLKYEGLDCGTDDVVKLESKTRWHSPTHPQPDLLSPTYPIDHLGGLFGRDAVHREAEGEPEVV